MRYPLLFLLLLLVPQVGCGQSPSWSMLNKTIRATYPEVHHITTDSLASWQEEASPLLLDVRAEDEFRVSHLQGARRLDPDTYDFAMLRDLAPDTPIVTYCSVGYRSAAMAERLMDAGFTNVVNLEGSIFAWANEGRTVYRDGEPVQQVHPYDAVWGVLLNKDMRAYTPSSDQ